MLGLVPAEFLTDIVNRGEHASVEVNAEHAGDRDENAVGCSNRYVSLTHDGRRAFHSAASTHMAEIGRLAIDHVPADKRAELTALLRPIADNLHSTMPRG